MKKEKWSKKDIIIAILVIIIVILIIINIVLLVNKDNTTSNISITDIEPIVKEYMTYDDKKIYLYNTNEIRLTVENKVVTLKEYLTSHKLTDLINLDNLVIDKTLKDGGTIIYHTQNKELFIQDLTIIACHTEDGNEDIYLGEYLNPTVAFKNGACDKHYIDAKTFTKVYKITKIKDITDSNTEEGKYKLSLTIADSNNKKVTIERVVSLESKNILTENTEFIFYFENTNSTLNKDDIVEIFNNCTLTGVVPNN